MNNPVHRLATWSIGEPRLLAGTTESDRVHWTQHRALHGDLPRLSRATYEELATTAGLLGRGGAGFPVARKLAALPRRGTHAVVVNGSESEPLSAKDRTLMRTVPHLVIDGALGIATSLRARKVLITVHDPQAAASLGAALRERPDARQVRIDLRPSRFVAGEARAVVRGASGGIGLPHGRRTLPSDDGLDGRATFLSNAETFAQLAILARLGTSQYADRGVAEEPGTSLLTVTGAVGHPGVIEVPNGVPLAVVLAAADAAPDAAVLVGGYHGTWVQAGQTPTLSRPALARAGLTFGAGVIAVLSEQTCPLGEVERVSRWLAGESAGQCGPCVFGLPAIVQDLARMLSRDPRGARDLQRHAGLVNGRGACAHPDGVARFVTSSLKRFGVDLDQHVRLHGCGRPVLGQLGTGPNVPWPGFAAQRSA